jgi:hypothetical protein
MQRRAGRDLHRATGRDDRDRLAGHRGAPDERLPGLRPSRLDDHTGAQCHRPQRHQLGTPDAADQQRPGLLGPEQPGDHRLAPAVAADHESGVADRQLQVVEHGRARSVRSCPAGHARLRRDAERQGRGQPVEVLAVEPPGGGALAGQHFA